MSKQYLALSPKFLSRLSYHYIWGLGLDRKGCSNFYDLLQELQSSAELFRSINDDTNKILNKVGFIGFIVRSLYWIFNINHYRQNYHKLQAYYSWRKYEEGIIMFTDSDREQVDKQGGFILKQQELEPSMSRNLYNGVSRCVEPVKWCVVTPIVWCAGGIRVKFFKNESSSPLKEAIISTDTHFNVDEKSQEHLESLGIDIEIGSNFLVSDLKKQHRKLCLKYHPDKPGGDVDKFISINEAYKSLLSHIYSDKSILGLKERYADYFAECRRGHEEADRCIERAHEENKIAHEVNVAHLKFIEDFEESEREPVEDMVSIDACKGRRRHSPTMFHNSYDTFNEVKDSELAKDEETPSKNGCVLS
ncbi:MAG: J domain-containing protein [Legionellaceae bacterium]|nr:J domain-containing protein [Legionellaceae bacterium]